MEDWQRYIGYELEPETGDPVTRRDIRHYALAIGDPNPFYHDPEKAKLSRYGGIIAPPCYVLWAARPAAQDAFPEELRADGLPRRTYRPPLPLQRWVRGGDEYEFHRPIRAGDTITARGRITDIVRKQGKEGDMYLVTTEFTYTNQKSETIATHRIVHIAR